MYTLTPTLFPENLTLHAVPGKAMEEVLAEKLYPVLGLGVAEHKVGTFID